MLDFNTEFLNLLQAPAYIRDAQLRLIYINPAAERLSGYSRAEVLAKKLKCWQVFGDVECVARDAICDDQFLATSIIPIVKEEEKVGVLVILADNSGHPTPRESGDTLYGGGVKAEDSLLPGTACPVGIGRLFAEGPVVLVHRSSRQGWPVEYVSDSIGQFGYSAAEFFAGELDFFDIVCLEDWARLTEEVQRNESEGILSFSLQYRIVASNHSLRWIYEQMRIVQDDAGKTIRLEGYLFDATEKRDLEIRLLQKKQEAREAEVQARFGHWDFFMPAGPAHFSEEVYRIFGWDKNDSQMSMEKILQSIHPDDRSGFIEKHRQALKNKKTEDREYRVLYPDGRVAHVLDHWQISFADDGTPIRCFGIIQDISEQKRAWEEVRRNRDMLDRVINTVPQAVFWKDRDGRFLGCNRVFASIFGNGDPADMIGLTDNDLPTDPLIAAAYRADDLEVMMSGRPKLHIIEPLHLHKGEMRWLDTSKAPLFDENGQAFGVLGVFDDISERKAMEDALEKRIIALTMPFDDPEGIEFSDLFNIADIQQLQDSFSKATGVSCLIIRPDGTAITEPSNFCALCAESVRQKAAGQANCRESDTLIGRFREDGPTIRRCLSAGLWDAGAAITVGGRHLASWLVGQVRDENLTEARIREYAAEIGADEEEMVRNFYDVPIMSREQFGYVSETLFTMANYLSTLAYQNVQQARYITQRKLAEQKLIRKREEIMEGRAKLSLALSLAQMGHWEGSFTLENDIIEGTFTFNDQFYEIYGTSAEREGGYQMEVGKYARELVHPDDGWMVADEISKIFKNPDPDNATHLEHRIIRRDGEVRYIAVRYIQLRNSQGEPVKTIGINQDITERKQAEEKLLKAKQEAEAANRAKSVFLANMSHEIRTPINGLMGMLQLLQESNRQPEQDEYIKLAIQSSRRLTRLLSDILDISRVEAGKMRISSETFQVRDALETVLQLFIPSVRAKGIQLRLSIDAAIPENITGDAVRLQQIIGNLLGNAVKFTPHGGIDVAVHLLSPVDSNSCRLLFIVADTGIGIADDTLKRLFIPFAQDDARYQHQFGGAGLGLAIVRQLTGLMGGTLAVVSEEGVGSTFYLSLPFGLAGHVGETETVATEIVVPAGLTVLLAEDDAISRVVGTQLLKNAGLQVTAVEDGAQVIERLRTDPFDLVILDVQMPVLDGIETTRAIRKGKAGRGQAKVPIIAMTACAMADDRDRLLGAGMDGYVEKPVEQAALLREVSRIMGGGVEPDGLV